MKYSVKGDIVATEKQALDTINKYYLHSFKIIEKQNNIHINAMFLSISERDKAFVELSAFSNSLGKFSCNELENGFFECFNE